MRVLLIALLAAISYAQTDYNIDSNNEKTIQQWKKVTSMHTKRWGLSVATIGKIMYAVAGQSGWDDNTILSSVEAYDPDIDSWRFVANMTQPRVGHSVVALNGKLYAMGGYWGNSTYTVTYKSAEVYDPEIDSWKQISPMLTRRDHASAVAIGNVLYVIGGCNEWNVNEKCTNVIDSIELYDPELDRWWIVAKMPTPRWGHSVSAYSNHVIIAGGESLDGKPLNSTDLWDAVVNGWAKNGPEMTTARSWLGVTVIGDQAFSVGGCAKTHCEDAPLSSAEMLTDARHPKEWIPIADMSTIRFEFATGSINNTLYAVGGCFDDKTYLETVEAFVIQ